MSNFLRLWRCRFETLAGRLACKIGFHWWSEWKWSRERFKDFLWCKRGCGASRRRRQ